MSSIAAVAAWKPWPENTPEVGRTYMVRFSNPAHGERHAKFTESGEWLDVNDVAQRGNMGGHTFGDVAAFRERTPDEVSQPRPYPVGAH